MNLFELSAILKLDTSQYEQGISKAGQDAEGFGEKFSHGIGFAKIGAAALGAAAGATVAFGASSVQAGMSFDTAMSQVGATMLKTSGEMEKEIGSVSTAYGDFSGNLREFAQFMGANTAFSATQAAEALNYMALAGYNTQESMDMLPNVMSLAAAGGMDLARASDMVTDTQTAFGISAERTSQMVDEMAKAASTGNTSVEQLGDAFLTVGGLAKELNGGFVTLADGTKKPVDGVQEMEIALTAMANAGIKGSEAGTHMRNMLMKLSSPTDAGAKQMEALGVSIFDSEGKMRSLQDIMGDLNTALGNLTQEQKIQAISDLFNARDLASAEALLGAVGQDWNEIGAAILDSDGAATDMANIQLDNLAGDITLFKSALEGAQITISDQLTPTLREFVQFGTEGVSQLSTAFQEGGLSGAMEVLGSLLSEGLSMLIENIPMVVEAAVQLLGAFGQGLIDNLPTLATAVLEILTYFYNLVVENGPQLLETGMQMLSSIIEGLVQKAPDLITKGGEMLTNLLTNIMTRMPEFMQKGGDFIMNMINGIGQHAPQIIASITTVLSNLLSTIMQHLPAILEKGVEIATNIAEGIIKNMPAVVKAIGEGLIELINTIGEHLPEFLEKGIEILGKIAEGLLQAVPDMISSVWGIVNDINAQFTEVDWISIGFNIIEGIKNGVIDAASGLASAAVDAVSGAWNAMTDWLGIASPSKRAKREIGANIAKGIALGFKEETGKTAGTMLGATQSIWDQLQDKEAKLKNRRQVLNDRLAQYESRKNAYSESIQKLRNQISILKSEGTKSEKSSAKLVKLIEKMNRLQEKQSTLEQKREKTIASLANVDKKLEKIASGESDETSASRAVNADRNIDSGPELDDETEYELYKKESRSKTSKSQKYGTFAPTINVYAQDQDVNELANEIMKRITFMFNKQEAAYGII